MSSTDRRTITCPTGCHEDYLDRDPFESYNSNDQIMLLPVSFTFRYWTSLDQNQNINLILEQTKKLVKTKIAPYALLWENEGKGAPSEVIKMLGDLGYFGILIDNKFGGLNQSIANYTKITEILARGDCGLTNLVNVSNSPVAMAIERYGSAYQQSNTLMEWQQVKRLAVLC